METSENKGITVLSLCDGISCGRLALKRAGVQVKQYIRAEIEPNANKIAESHFPGDINLGNVLNINIRKTKQGSLKIESTNHTIEVDKIDLVIFGSECQSFSLQGKQLGFVSVSGQVMLHCINICKQSGCDYFLAENVKMKPVFRDAISEMIGVKPVLLNSIDFGGVQSRGRLYWTNIPVAEQSEFKQPKNVSDIIEGEGHPMTCRKGKNGAPRTIHRTSHFGCATRSYFKGIRADGRPAIGTVESGLFDDHYPGQIRQLTPEEFEAIQSIPKCILQDCLRQKDMRL